LKVSLDYCYTSFESKRIDLSVTPLEAKAKLKGITFHYAGGE